MRKPRQPRGPRRKRAGKKRRPYRAVPLPRVCADKVDSMVAEKHVVFGVDVAKEELYGRLELEDGSWQLTVKWRQPDDTATVVAFLRHLPASAVEVVMEPSGTYGDPLRYQLLTAGIPVFAVNPKRSHDAAEVYDGVPSYHDAKSAAILVKLHLDGASARWELPPEAQRDLVAKLETKTRYDDDLGRARNRLEAKLGRHWPELPGLLDLTSATLLTLLVDFGSPAEVTRDADRAQERMRAVGGNFLEEDKIQGVVATAANTTGLPMTEVERRSLQRLAADALSLRKAAARAERELVAATAGSESAQRQAKAVGRGTAAVLTATVGEAATYENAGAYQKAFGLNLKTRRSGKFVGQLKITKRGPGIARRYLYLATLRLVQNDWVTAAWYHRKVDRDGGHKRKAIVAIMRKLAAALWHVARGAAFDTTRLFDTRRLGPREEVNVTF